MFSPAAHTGKIQDIHLVKGEAEEVENIKER